MRVIFLDIDGVLWTVGGDMLSQKLKIKHPDHRELDPTRVVLLEELLSRYTDVKVVVSSTWRLGRTIKELQEILGPIIGPRIIGKTVSLRGKDNRSEQRGREITHWLKNTTEKVTDVIILDDDADMIGVAQYWWKCNAYDGMSFLTYADLNQYLQRDPNSFYSKRKRLTNWLQWATIIVKYHCYRKWAWSLKWRVQEWWRSYAKRRSENTSSKT